MNTTSVTQGETPTRVYRVDESLEFNGGIAAKSSDVYTAQESIGIWNY